MLNRRSILQLMGGASLVAGAGLGVAPAFAADKLRIAMVVKALGNGFFDACRDGGLEAAKELGNVDLIYTGPTKATAEEQIAVIESLIAREGRCDGDLGRRHQRAGAGLQEGDEPRHQGDFVRLRHRAGGADHASRTRRTTP